MSTRAITILGLAALWGCGGSSEAGTERAEIATLPVSSTGATVTLMDLGDGEVGMLEDVSVFERSVLDDLVGQQHATALEVFRALAPPEVASPPALRRAHQRAVGEVAPRTLAVARDSARSYTHFDTQVAECTLTSDGVGYFDSVRDALGWNWFWYRIHTNYVSAGTEERVSDATSNTSTYRAHVCNGGRVGYPSAKLPFTVERLVGGYGCDPKTLFDRHLVSKDRRVVFFQSSAPVCSYRAKVEVFGTVGYPVTWSMGVMAP